MGGPGIEGLAGMLIYWIGGAALLLIIGAPVFTVFCIIGRLALKPIVRELANVRRDLRASRGAGVGNLEAELHQIVEQLYYLNNALVKQEAPAAGSVLHKGG